MHAVIDRVDDEAARRKLVETANWALVSRDILDNLAAEQLTRLMESRERGRQGDYSTLDEFKKTEQK